MNKFELTNKLDTFFLVFTFIVFLLPYILQLILYYTTHFEKVITIKEKDRFSDLRVVDTDSVIYDVVNVPFLLDFNASDQFFSIENNQKYKVKGYGKRIPSLGLYHEIYDVKHI